MADGWYNPRGASLVRTADTGTHLRLTNDRVGLPAHLMQAFSLGAAPPRWLSFSCRFKLTGVQRGRTPAQAAGVLLHFLNADYESARCRTFGPWTGTTSWRSFAAPVQVPAGAREAVLTMGLFGGTGAVDFDEAALSPYALPRSNLLLNPDFRFGLVHPLSWTGRGGWTRQPLADGYCLTLTPRSSLVQATWLGEARPARLLLDFEARSPRKRPGLGRALLGFFPEGAAPAANVVVHTAAKWSRETLDVDVPVSAKLAVVRFAVAVGMPSMQVRRVRLRGFTSTGVEVRSGFEHRLDGPGWYPYRGAERVAPGSPLDAGSLLDPPAGKHGRVTARDGRLVFADGSPARFFGVQVRAPTAFLLRENVEPFVDRLVRAGVNLVWFAGLEDADFWQRNLLDPDRPDSTHLSPVNLAALDRLCAALRERGLYYALSPGAARTLREGDGVDYWRDTRPGLPVAGLVDDRVARQQTELALTLLGHRNPYTHRRYADDPALVFVTVPVSDEMLARLTDPGREALPASLARRLDGCWNAWLEQRFGDRSSLNVRWTAEGLPGLGPTEDPAEGTVSRAVEAARGRPVRRQDLRRWSVELVETAYARQVEALRRAGVRALVAGAPTPVVSPAQLLVRNKWDTAFAVTRWAPSRPVLTARALAAVATIQRHPFAGLCAGVVSGRPTIAVAPTEFDNGWGNPYQWLEPLALSAVARVQGWDALVCGEVFETPRAWGGHIPGTVPADAVAPYGHALNSQPAVVAQLPTAARLFLGGAFPAASRTATVRLSDPDFDDPTALARNVPGWFPFALRVRMRVRPPFATSPNLTVPAGGKATALVEWRSTTGCYVVRTARLVGAAGFLGGQTVDLGPVTLRATTPCCAVFVETLDGQPLSRSTRVLVTVGSLTTQTGMTFADGRLLQVVALGRPPMLVAPVQADLTLRLAGNAREWAAFSLSAAGHRVAPLPVRTVGAEVLLTLPDTLHTYHLELSRKPR